MQRLFAYNALTLKNTITILTLILFVVFLVRGLYLFAVLGKHLPKSNQGFQYQQQARDIRNSFYSTLSNFTYLWYLAAVASGKFKKSAKGGCSQKLTYLSIFYGPKIGGGVPPTRGLSKNIKNPDIWPILGYFRLQWAGPAEKCCTPVYLPIGPFAE